MQIINYTVATAVALFVAFPAQATDIGAAPASSWTGAYVGFGLGARLLDTDWTTTQGFLPNGTVIPFQTVPNASFSDASVRVSGYLGYNWQIAPIWLLGVEADIGFSDNKKAIDAIPGLLGLGGGATFASTTSVKATWDGSARLRAGHLVTPLSLIYATGGLAWQHLESRIFCPSDGAICNPASPPQSGNFSDTRLGWTAGAGIETMIGANWFARIEYRYSDFGSFNFTALQQNPNTFGAVADIETKTHIATVGIAYRFGDFGKMPVVTGY